MLKRNNLSPLIVLFAVVIACSKFEALQGSYDRHGVKDVALTLSATTPSGKYFTEIVYRSSGRVEKTVRDFNLDGSVKEKTDRFGSVSKEEFQKIEDNVINNNFFGKPDVGPSGSRAVIKVTSDTGVKQVDQGSTSDPEIQAVARALSGPKITWDGPPKNVN